MTSVPKRAIEGNKNDYNYNFTEVFKIAEQDAESSARRKRKYTKGAYADLKPTEVNKPAYTGSKPTKVSKDTMYRYDATTIVPPTKNLPKTAPRKILDIHPQFDGDNRKGLCIVRSCMTCAYFKQRTNSRKMGFCLLATRKKFSTMETPMVVIPNAKNYERNKLYSEINWVHAHAGGYCESYTHSNMKLSVIDRWIREHTNTDTGVKFRAIKGDGTDTPNLKYSSKEKEATETK